MLASEPVVTDSAGPILDMAETCFIVLFATEFVLRLWSCTASARFGDGWRGRLRYLTSPAAFLDFLALSPALLTMVGPEAFLLRLLRLLRILRIARLGRFSKAWLHVGQALTERRHELFLTAGLAATTLLVAATLLHLVEGGVQPDAFGSIPRAMWWAVVTLTTVGYGDVYPVTVPGRLLASVTAVAGIGLIAMPTGIFAAAFSDALQRGKQTPAVGSAPGSEP